MLTVTGGIKQVGSKLEALQFTSKMPAKNAATRPVMCRRLPACCNLGVAESLAILREKAVQHARDTLQKVPLGGLDTFCSSTLAGNNAQGLPFPLK